jgi:lipopolysaccharide/colanic/teichoic acid biosynthesis glycosyltransferase
MVDFPPISKEDNPEFLAAYVLSHYESTGDIIAYSQIHPTMSGSPLKIAKKRKSKKDKSDDGEEAEVKPKKLKKALKIKVSEPTISAIQE